jgi:arabinogalactan endo-1,4-beta-galactosidase
MSNRKQRAIFVLPVLFAAPFIALGSQPPEPIDITPLNGEVYYIVNQLSGLQVDLSADSTAAGIVQQPRSFTSLSQRWAFTKLSSGWRISNMRGGACLHGGPVVPDPVKTHPRVIPHARGTETPPVVQAPCTAADTGEWTLTPANNGYYTISNATGLTLDLSHGSISAGTPLVQTRSSGVPTQSQQWLLRPAFFRGVDNALLEKQEAARAASGLPWWQDAGQLQDVLAIFKNHGVNMVRLRPSSTPPYANVSQPQCAGDACYGETDAQDLDLARRAKNLGMSIELTLLFDGANSMGVPPAWAGDTGILALQSDLYAYIKAEILSYRQAGAMPDLVSIGNEVDTGFLGPIGSPTGADFAGFAALQTEAAQAIRDAAADTSSGPAIPPPLTCIHITPAWDLSQFFALANEFNVPYDAICQSYYPLFHGPLTDAQAAAANPNNKPVEQDVLVNAANKLGKPIFIIETGEHYENGFDANDSWYSPPTQALQRQFLLDLQAVVEGLPNNLGMGIEYWDPAGVNIPNATGGFINGDNLPGAVYTWNGLTLFDNADTSGSTNITAPNYSMLLPAMDALGGKLDPTLSYKFVNAASGHLLTAFQVLDTEADNGSPSLSQQWRISSAHDGYFQIASLNPGAGNTVNLLDSPGASGANVTIAPSSTSGQNLEWDVVSAGNGYFRFVNRASGLVLDLNNQNGAVAQPPDTNKTQQWQIVPVH